MAALRFAHVKYTSIEGKRYGPHVLILAGVHGDEYEPIAAASRLLTILAGQVQQGKVTIAPVVNRPAFRRGARTGEDGLDLARSCPGKREGTTTEVIAWEVSGLIATSDYLIDLHTGGTFYSIDPLCGYMLHQSPEVLEKQRQMARAFNLKTVWGTSDKLNGRTLSVARDHNIPAIYTEYGGGGGFRSFVVEEYVQGCLNVLALLGLTRGMATANAVQYEVEDYRDESGHLQVMLAAEHEGLFEPEVNLGDFVKKGQTIGSLYDPVDGQRRSVCADQDGMVFMIRAVPSVLKGDSLGGILPVDKQKKVVIR
jgi:predicted deacylase